MRLTYYPTLATLFAMVISNNCHNPYKHPKTPSVQFLNRTIQICLQTSMTLKAEQHPTISPSALPLVAHGYKFQKVIGKGGFSDVYLVWSLKYREPFVAKVMTVENHQMDALWKSFTAEVSALCALNFPNIIRMYDHFRIANQFVVILECCPSGSLADKISRSNGLGYSEFQRIAGEILRAVAFCHSKHIAHRDIKPSNILIDRYGRMKLADFGLSLKAPRNILQYAMCGSIVYTAPEVLSGKPNNPFQSDVWSLGVLFAVMAQGKSPWLAHDVEEMKQKIQNCDYYLDASVHDDIKEIIEMMLQKDPAKRISLRALLEKPFFQKRKVIEHVPTECSMRPVVLATSVVLPRGSRGWSVLQSRRASALDLSHMQTFQPAD